MQQYRYLKKPFISAYNFLKDFSSIGAVLVFAIVVFSIYSNSLQGPFVFDDVSRIEQNELIRLTSLNWVDLKETIASFSGRRQLSMLSFALNYYFHGYNLFGYHLVNVLFHLTNAILLYFILKTIFSLLPRRFLSSNDRLIPFYSTLLWLAHPLHTQSVSYIVQRENSMATMFFLLSLFLFLKARISDNRDLSKILFVSSFCSAVMALFSKQNAATLPVFIFLAEWFFFQELNIKWLKRNYLVVFGLIVIMGVIAVWFSGAHPLVRIVDDYYSRDFTLGQRLMTQFRVVVFYMSLIVFPHPARLNLDHDFPLSFSLIDPITTFISMMLIFSLVGLAIIFRKRDRMLSFCVLWFFGNLIIESSVIGLEIIFEHRTYLPSIFTASAFILVLYRLIDAQNLRAGVVILLISILSFWTFERNKIWANDLALWLDCAIKSPNKVRPYNNAAQQLMSRDRYADAKFFLLHAVKLDPHNQLAQNNLGITYSVEGKLDSAAYHVELALKIDSSFTDAHNNLGIIYMKQGNFNKSSIHFSHALEGRPNDVSILSNLGVTEAKKGNFKEAISHFLIATQIEPGVAFLYANIGDAYKDLSKFEEAREYYSIALSRDPSNERFKRKLQIVSTIIKTPINQDKKEN